jgi:hypothetical protein
MAYPPACYKGKEEYHVFVIGDWGGMCGYAESNDCNIAPEEARAAWDWDPHPFQPFPMRNNRGARKGVDDSAQHHVRDRMSELALKVDPEFVLNVGDSFYPGSIIGHCATLKSANDLTKMPSQFNSTYERFYNGKGLEKKEWLSVLGNHDYGGVCFNMGWGQQVFYTWNDAGTKRWIMPSQYYSRQVRFDTGAGLVIADMWFLDTNIDDTRKDADHDICSKEGNTFLTDIQPPNKQEGWYCKGFLGEGLGSGDYGVCEGTNFTSPQTCGDEFARLWEEQQVWLEEGLKNSQADWQIIVTHYPAHYPLLAKALRPLSAAYGVDLIVTGHTHEQMIFAPGDTTHDVDYGQTARIVSGGGGGIFSEGPPNPNGNDDTYGFMDLVVTKEEITIKAYSWGPNIESISVAGSTECSGDFHKAPWPKNERIAYTNAGQTCTLMWDDRKQEGSKQRVPYENGWVLVKGQDITKDSKPGYLCLGGMEYTLPEGDWHCKDGAIASLTITRGDPILRRSVPVKPVLPSQSTTVVA